MRLLGLVLYGLLVPVIGAYSQSARGPTLTVSVSPNPPAQMVAQGSVNHVFANYNLDATASSEDIRMHSISLRLSYNGKAGGRPDGIVNCKLWFGGKPITLAVNPSSIVPSRSDLLFTFMDSGLIVKKGTGITITLEGDILPGTPTGDTFAWGLTDGLRADYIGITSGDPATVRFYGAEGQVQTVGTVGPTILAPEPPVQPQSWRRELMLHQTQKMAQMITEIGQILARPSLTMSDLEFVQAKQRFGEIISDNEVIERVVLMESGLPASEYDNYVMFRTVWLSLQNSWNRAVQIISNRTDQNQKG